MFHEILSADDIAQIHETAMRLLAEVGVDLPYAPAQEAFRQHGVRVDGKRAYLTEQQVMDAIAQAPRQFPIHARNPERSVTVGAGRPVFAPGYGAPFLVDLDEGKRAPTMEDYHDLVKLAHQLPNQDMSGHLIVEPGGVDADTAHIRMLHAHIVHSDKPFIGSAAGRKGAEDTFEMARIVFGDLDRPVTICLVNSLTPLGFSTEMLEALVAYAQARQPMVVAALAMAGSTAPITLAGALATQTAELLAGIALSQMISPGTPVVFGSTSTNIDMASGALAIGSPELSQMIAAHAQLARHYGLPSRSGGALTDASFPDAQAGFESMMSLLTTVNSGVDFVLHAGGILSSYLAFSFEKLVLDDEMCGMVRRLHQGITVSPDTLAYDIIAHVGPGGNYLMEMHTVKRCRKEFWRPALCDRGGLEAWMQAGQPTAAGRARERRRALIAEHQDPPLDDAVVRQLQKFVDERI
ncbi:MAG: trimethylamine methyltransferase family protein [Anaerolineae bacterium]|nr:trimethylamine methyltransferase family protein [Anaerolineae bacterium]